MAAFFVLLVFGNTIQAITGFAGTVLIMPVLLVLVGRETAVPIINLLGLCMTIFMAIRERKQIQWSQIRKICLWLLSGIVIGFLFQTYLSSVWLRRGYGVMILICVSAMILQRRKQQTDPFPQWLNILLLVGAGIMHSIFASGGPLLVLYMMAQLHNKTQFRATMSAVWVATNIMLGVQHWLAGYYTPVFWLRCAILLPAVALGTLLGYCLYPKVSAEAFFRLACVLLIFAGIYTIFF